MADESYHKDETGAVGSERPMEMRAFMIADLRGYAAGTESHGDQWAADLLTRFGAVVRACVAAHRGRVLRQNGDEVSAVFRSAQAALRAALDVLDRCDAATKADPRLPLRAGIGVAAGSVVRRDDEDYSGAVLNLTARLCSLAVAGEVLASRDAIAMARRATEIASIDRGTAALKGFAAPVPLVRVVRGGVAARAELPAPDVTPDPWLPQPLTAMLGREEDARAALVTLRHPQVRLLSLTGPGGVGKTRLSLDVAAHLRDEFADGVFFVELDAVHDAELVLPTIARRLGLRLTGGQPATDQLIAAMHGKRMLWVLDNFEQVLDGAPHVGHVLAACGAVKVLATSRAPLRLRGEHELPLAPLRLPDPMRTVSREEVLEYPAIRLFLERAAAAQPGFELMEADLPSVIAICRHLDGLPLALELAAARVRILPIPRLHAHLVNSGEQSALRLLAGGPRDLPARQQTMRAAIDWSHALLDPPDRTLFRRLAVFKGGATYEALEEICAAGGARDDGHIDILDAIAGLVEQSLVLRRDVRGESRYVLLETIREYAHERLTESGELDALARRHAEYYRALAERLEDGHAGPDQAGLLHIVEREHGNVRVALNWLGANDLAGALGLAGALRRFWEARGHGAEGRRWLTTLLEAAEERTEHVPRPVYARALYTAGELALRHREHALASRWLSTCLALREAEGDASRIADTLALLALAGLEQDGRERARDLLTRGVDLWRAVGGQPGLAAALFNRGSLAHGDDNRGANACFEECLSIWRGVGDSRGAALALYALGTLAHDDGDDPRATVCLQDSLSLYRELGAERGVAMVLAKAGLVARTGGDYRRAQVLLEEALALRKAMGDTHAAGRMLLTLSRVAHDLGDAERAAWLAREGEAALAERGYDHDHSRAQRHASDFSALAPARTAAHVVPPGDFGARLFLLPD